MESHSTVQKSPTRRCGEMETYKVIRFYKDWDRPNKTILTGLTLEEAQAHCRRDDTHGEGWFDGYDKENNQ